MAMEAARIKPRYNISRILRLSLWLLIFAFPELAKAIDHYQRDLEDRPYPWTEGIKTAIDLYAEQNPAAKGVDPERFIDASLMRELDRGGFFATLASGGK